MTGQTQANPARKTNYTMKVLFCFGITFITAGHVPMGGGTSGLSFAYNVFPVQGFHVAIFLFVAGYFYHCKHEAKPLDFLKKKFLRLIVPLYLLSWVYGVFTLVLHQFGFQIGQDPTPYNMLVDPIFGTHAFMWNCPLWFVAPFFLAQVVDFGLRLLLKVGGSKPKEAALIVLYAAIGLATTSLALHFLGTEGFAEGSSSIWVLLARTGFFMPCFALGRFYKVFAEQYDDRIPNWLWLGACIALQLAAFAVMRGHIFYIVSWCAYASGRFMPYATMVIGIAFWLRISKMLAPALEDSKSMNLIAGSTFSIMAHQFFGFFVLKLVFAALAAAGAIHGFDMHAFLTDIWYYWTPMSGTRPAGAPAGAMFIPPQVFCTVYIAAGLLIPCGIHALWSKIYGAARTRLRPQETL